MESIFITMCAYAHQGYVFGCVSLCIYLSAKDVLIFLCFISFLSLSQFISLVLVIPAFMDLIYTIVIGVQDSMSVAHYQYFTPIIMLLSMVSFSLCVYILLKYTILIVYFDCQVPRIYQVFESRLRLLHTVLTASKPYNPLDKKV